MGFSNSKNKTPKKAKTTEKKEKNELFKINEVIKKEGTNEKNNIVKECLLEVSPFEKIDQHISNISKSICKIQIITKKENDDLERKFGTGFLLNFRIDQELFYCLMSNEHVINKDILNNNNINNAIYIYYDNEFKIANINVDVKKRYIKSFIDFCLDITVVEILDKDNISKDYFLFPEQENEKNTLIGFSNRNKLKYTSWM